MKAPQGMPVPMMEALGAVADALEQGRNPESNLSRAIDMLSIVPATGIVHVHVHVHAHIQYYARLWLPMAAYNLASSHKVGRPRYGEMIKHAPKLQYLFLFHQDGYARQAALEAIVAVPPAKFFFSAILPRLNDWVPEVRAAAVACLERILPLSDPDTVFELILALFYQSRNWARWTDESSLLLERLQEPAMLLRLLTWLRTAGGGRLSSFMRILLQRPIIDAHLYDLARHAEAPSVRGRALRVLLDGGADWEETPPQTGRWRAPPQPVLKTRRLCVALPAVQDLVDLGLSDRSAKVRKVLASKVVAVAPKLPNLNRVIDRLLADPNAAVRWRGDFLNRTLRKPAQGEASVSDGTSQGIDLSEDIGLLSPQSIEVLRTMFGCMVDCDLVGGWVHIPLKPDKPVSISAHWIRLRCTPVGPAPRYLPLDETRPDIWLGIDVLPQSKTVTIDRMSASTERPKGLTNEIDNGGRLVDLTSAQTYIGRFRPVRQIDIVATTTRVAHMDHDMDYGRFALDTSIELCGQSRDSEVRFVISRTEPGHARPPLSISIRPPAAIGEIVAGMEDGKAIGDLRLRLCEEAQ